MLWDAAEATNIRNEKINSEYEAVVKCAIDAKTCANYWLKYALKKDYEYAGQWRDLLDLLNLRVRGATYARSTFRGSPGRSIFTVEIRRSGQPTRSMLR